MRCPWSRTHENSTAPSLSAIAAALSQQEESQYLPLPGFAYWIKGQFRSSGEYSPSGDYHAIRKQDQASSV